MAFNYSFDQLPGDFESPWGDIKPEFPTDAIPSSAWEVDEDKPSFLESFLKSGSYLQQAKDEDKRRRDYDARYEARRKEENRRAVTADLGGGNTLYAPDQSMYLRGMGVPGSQGSSSGGVGRFAGQALGSALAGAVPGVGPFLAPVGAAIGGFFGDKLPF